MRANVHKLDRVLILSVWLLVVPGVSLCVHTTPAESVWIWQLKKMVIR